MQRLAALFVFLLLAAPAHAIPGVTIPFPQNAEEQPSEDPIDDAVSDIVLGDQPALETGTPIEAVPATEAGPWLMSQDYPRPEMMEGSVIRLVWHVQIEDMEGAEQGDPITRTVLVGPYFAYDTGETPPVLYDFTHARRLVANPEAGTYRNTSIYGDVRRRLDTYMALSRAGTLDDIPFGPGRSFDRFWLESAMGLRRTPADLTTTESDGRIAVLRAGGLQIFSFDARLRPDRVIDDSEHESGTELDDDEAPDEAENAETDGDNAFEGAPTDDIAALLRGDFGGDEADADTGDAEEEDLPRPTSGPDPVTGLDPTDEGMHYGLMDPVFGTAFRGWMRQALPIHPDAFAAQDAAATIPERFCFMVVSPNSTEGRREI